MHHPDSAGDSGSVRKVAHPAIFPGRGSNTGSGSGSTLSSAANSVVNNSHVPGDDYQSALLIQTQTAVVSPTPGLQHPPPQTLNLQSQPAQSAGAQMKKKSGFQITSVTLAQVSVSTNNSIAEDTESYDDLDESHTEDLSSSEILDASLSRANDTAGAERSSSEETLNNFHEVETPGALSPNQPTKSGHGGNIMNGAVHHHYQHQHHPHQAQAHAAPGTSGTPPLAPGALPCVTQKMPSNVGVIQEKVPTGIPVGAVATGSVPGIHTPATGLNPQPGNFSNVNMLSSANVPVRGIISSASASSINTGFPPGLISSGGSGGVVIGGVTNSNINVVQQQQQYVYPHVVMTTTTATTTTTTTTTVAAVAVASGVPGFSSLHKGGVGAALTQPGGGPVSAMTPAHVPSTLPQSAVAAPAPAATATSSRFRVVKLDSSSEPFKKGRWTCTDYYDKDAPGGSQAPEVVCPGARHFTPDGSAGLSEKDGGSGGSVSSSVSTLSRYTESTGSGEMGGAQQPQDYSSPPHVFQPPLPAGLNMGASHTPPLMHPHDLSHAHLKTTPSAPTGMHQPAPVAGHHAAMGHPVPFISQQQQQQQQLTYAQAVAAQPPGPAPDLAVGQQQQQPQAGYASLPQQSSAAAVKTQPPEYTQSHHALPQALPQVLPQQTSQLLGGPQQHVGPVPAQQPQAALQPQPQQTLSRQVSASTAVPQIGVAGSSQPPQSHPLPLDGQAPQSLPAHAQNQAANVAHMSQASATSVPLLNPPSSDPQAHGGNRNAAAGPQIRLARIGATHQDFPSSALAQAQAHAAQTSALYASLPTFTPTQLEDAHRLLMQHQSALLGLPKLPTGDGVSMGTAVLGQGAEGNPTAASALTASAALLKTDGDEDGSSGASVVAIDNKIEQAMDLVKSHLMYAVREEVEVLKEQIKELIERNSQLEQENTLLKTLASPEQMAQFQAQVQTGSPPASTAAPGPQSTALQAHPVSHSSGPSA